MDRKGLEGKVKVISIIKKKEKRRTTSVGKDVEKSEALSIAGGKIHSLSGKSFGSSSQA